MAFNPNGAIQQLQQVEMTLRYDYAILQADSGQGGIPQ